MVSKLQELMDGRNGVDQFCVAMFLSSFAMNTVAYITRRTVLSSLSALLFLGTVCRALSKNVQRRQAENYRFVRILSDARDRFKLLRIRITQFKNYRFFNCPGCKSNLRVKRSKGRIQITCPRCGLRFAKKM